MRVTRPSLLAVAAMATCLSAAGLAQTPMFSSRTDLVSVFATVTDGSGALASGLTADDFEVFDNGKRQPIRHFSTDVQPLSAVLMIDRSASLVEQYDVVREAAGRFVDRLLPADRARIGDFSMEIKLRPETFTNDPAVLQHALRDELQQAGPSPVWAALGHAITALLPENGRRVVLLFSDGRDVPPDEVKTKPDDVLYRAQYDDVMIYAIGVPTERPGETGVWDPPDPTLRKIALSSGGGYFELERSANLGAIFTRIADELHRQYWLGFRPPSLDRRVHKLEVKVKRPGYLIRARTSYVADPQR